MNNIGIKERQNGRVTILAMDGKARVALRFGGRSVSLHSAVECLIEDGKKLILLNLSGVNHIDAAGFSDLLSSHVTLIENGGEVKLFNLAGGLRQSMVDAKLLRFFEIYETESDAVKSFGEPSGAPANARRVAIGESP